MNKKTVILSTFFTLAALSFLFPYIASAIGMLAGVVHTGTPESQEVYYANDSITFTQFSLDGTGAVDIGNANIGVGDYQDTTFKVVNTAKLPIEYVLEIPTQDNVTASFACNQSGVKYATDNSDSTKFVIKVNNPALTTSLFNWRSTVDADAPATNGTYPIDRTFAFARIAVDTNQTWTTCP